jgi:hypothetical protein
MRKMTLGRQSSMILSSHDSVCFVLGVLAGLPVSGLFVAFLAQVFHEFSGMIGLNAIRPGVYG